MRQHVATTKHGPGRKSPSPAASTRHVSADTCCCSFVPAKASLNQHPRVPPTTYPDATGNLRTTLLLYPVMNRSSCFKRLNGNSVHSLCRACEVCPCTRSQPSHPRFRPLSYEILAWSSPCAKVNPRRGMKLCLVEVDQLHCSFTGLQCSHPAEMQTNA